MARSSMIQPQKSHSFTAAMHKPALFRGEGTQTPPLCGKMLKNLQPFFFKTSLLEYNCFTMLCQFLLYNKVNQLYVYIYPHISSLLHLSPTLPIPPLQVVTKHRANLPVKNQRLEGQPQCTFFLVCFLLLFLIFVGVQLIYNIVLVSGVQQSDSVIHVHISIFVRFFSHVGYYRILSKVPCAIQKKHHHY